MVSGGKFSLGLLGPLGSLVILAIYCTHLLFHVDHQKGLFGYLQARNKGKFEQLERYLSNSTLVDPDCVREIREIYDAEIFASYTGIYAEKAKRDELIWLHKRIGKHPSWKLIKLIHESIEFDDLGKIFIKPYNRIQKYLVGSLRIIAIILFIAGQLLWMLAFRSGTIGGVLFGVFIYVATIFICVRIAKIYARQYLVMHAADELKNRSSEDVAADQIVSSGEARVDEGGACVVEIPAANRNIAAENTGPSSDLSIVH